MQYFAPDRMRILAGDTAFTRGEADHAEGAVSLVSSGPEDMLAIVRGSENDRVRLRGGGSHVSGECTCPVFDLDGWCQHLVAAGLAANAVGAEVPDRRGAIRAHLLGLGTEALADMLLDLTERDPALLRRLGLVASAAGSPVMEHAARLRETLRGTLRPRYYVDYDAASNWTDAVLDTLEQIPALIAAGAAGEAKDLLETVLDEVPGALEQVDDSDGGGMEILERAAALHLDACRAMQLEPLVLAAELFERAWDSDGFGTFERADETYAEMLGKVGLAEYQRLAEAAYARLPPVGRDDADPKSWDRRRLTEILDRFATRVGDLDRRIALRRAALANARDYLALACFCLDQGRPNQAREVAADGAWLFEVVAATELIELLAERLVAEGRREEAIAALWRGFERAPAFSLFRALQGLAVPEAADRSLALLRRQHAAMGKADRWRHSVLIELELEILMAMARLGEAWEVTRSFEVGDGLLLRLARASEEQMNTTACRSRLAPRCGCWSGDPGFGSAAADGEHCRQPTQQR